MLLKFPPAVSHGLAGCKRYLAATAVFSFFANLLTLALPLYTVQLYDRVLLSGSGATLTVITIAAVAALTAATIIEDVRGRLLVVLGCSLDARPSATLFRNEVDAVGTEARASGHILRDLDTFRHVITGSGTLALLDLAWTPIFVAVVFLLHPVLGTIVGVGSAAIAALAVANQIAVARPLADAGSASEESYRFTDMVLRRAEVVQAMGMLSDLMPRWSKVRQSAIRGQAAASTANAHFSSLIRLLRYCLQIAIFAAGAWLVVQRDLTGGALFASSLLTTRALMPIDQIVGVWRQLVSGWVAMRRVEAAYASPPRPAAMRLPRPKGELVVDQVTYAPPGAKRPVLQEVSFAAHAGEAIGVVGASAAGKSTLVRLIVGAARPTTGVVRLDGADAYSWDRFEFGRAVGYVPQSVDLLDGSIKENIARFRDADSADIVDAARLAGVHGMILDLPDGYETRIGATGAVLSGGQRQRIAHARAVFGNPALVVLDEPSSSLDGEGEAALLQMLADLKARRVTVLLIAHRPSMLLSLDRILVLTNGRAAAFGPTQQIMPQIAPGFAVPLPRKIAAIA